MHIEEGSHWRQMEKILYYLESTEDCHISFGRVSLQKGRLCFEHVNGIAICITKAHPNTSLQSCISLTLFPVRTELSCKTFFTEGSFWEFMLPEPLLISLSGWKWVENSWREFCWNYQLVKTYSYLLFQFHPQCLKRYSFKPVPTCLSLQPFIHRTANWTSSFQTKQGPLRLAKIYYLNCWTYFGKNKPNDQSDKMKFHFIDQLS